ncbi:MAG TPA: AmmeMemoRadiSam system radical SAM enzyme, partial [Bacteroidota bacterium]|nr:AmmeMemoRadiSam system radical SAM enzyme [Bacteroidota bacterium]
DRQYRKLGGVLRNVLETIQRLHTLKFWIEVVTLIVPGFNDSEEEIRDIADFLVAVSPDIPWHVTAFHSDYKMTEVDRTTAGTLLRAVEIGYGAGLHYVYAGNLPGQVGKFENTFCPSCHSTVIERRGFTVLQNILKNGACPKCATAIAGFWDMPVSRNLQ